MCVVIVVVILVVVLELVVVRNECYNGYVPKVMLCFSSGTWIKKRKVG
jgi:hypothetical protein